MRNGKSNRWIRTPERSFDEFWIQRSEVYVMKNLQKTL